MGTGVLTQGACAEWEERPGKTVARLQHGLLNLLKLRSHWRILDAPVVLPAILMA